MPHRRAPGAIAICVLIFVIGGIASAQDNSGKTATDGSQEGAAIPSAQSLGLTSVQEKNSFSTSATAFLRRAAIVSFGALPFAIFYGDFVFDTVRFAQNGFDILYAPWPFKNQYSTPVSNPERMLRLGTAFAASLAIGLADAFMALR